MSHRNRTNAKIREAAAVQTTDPAALATYAKGLRAAVATIRALAEDATLPPSKRVHARAFLRDGMLKAIREVETRLDVAEHGDPAGCGGAGPVA